MSATTPIVVIADIDGRVLAAELPTETKAASKEGPTARLRPLRGQRSITIELPTEVLKLPGPTLHRFFSEVQIRSTGEIRLPKIKITRTHD
jgi:hypothetical protein